jgi:SAM-dependent methyltransferase
MGNSGAGKAASHRPQVAAAMDVMRRLAGIHPPLFNSLWKLVYPRKRYSVAVGFIPQDRTEAFDTLYRSNAWGSEESVSGMGSTLAATLILRRELPRLLRGRGVRTMLDAPCGDFNWMRHVDLNGVNYIGGDIVPELVERTAARYGSADREFRLLDILADPLPPADLFLCRDVLIHFSNEDALKLLRRAARAPIRYLLTTHYELCPHNADIHTGGFRPINLNLPPFNLPKPLRRIDDFVMPFRPRSVALWSRDQLREALGIKDEAD